MPVTINTSNIFIETATSNYTLDLVRKKSKRKNIVEDTATVTPSLNSKYSYTDNLYKYMNFTYDETIYPSIPADTNNLIVWWKFDSNLLFHNSAPNPLSLTLTSRNNAAADGTFTMTDKYLGSGSFYKSTQSDLYGYNITPSNWLSQSLGLEATFAFWVKQTYSTTTNMESHIFRQDNSFIIRQYNTTGFQVYIAPDNFANVDIASGDFLFTYDTWVHVTVTVNMNSGTQINDVVNIYKNGVLRPTTVTGTYSTVIGVGFNNDSDNFRFTSSSDTTNFDDGFMGYLDDFRIYNKCLSGEEVNELYRSYRATEYNVNFDNDIDCDLLIIGAGGGGSRSIGGGGGAGALIYDNFTFRAGQDYKFRVGKGGMGVSVPGNISGTVTTDMKTGENGGDTEIIIENSCLYRAKGGGGGTGDTTDYTNPSTQEAGRGGSGGGNGGKDTAHGGLLSNENIVNGNVIAVARNVYNSSHAPHYLSTKIYGNEGGIGNGNNPWGGSGGGGAGARGTDCNSLNPTANNLVKGGDGLAAINDMDFGTYFNIKNKEIGHHYNGQVYFAGGGGGGNYDGNVYYNDGGLGGGGRSGMVNTGRLSTIDGLPNTGGGGGGEGFDQYQGGHGGSGIIILKHKLYYKDGDDCTIQWIHDNASDKMHSFGSVGIGTDGDEKYMLNVKGDINFTGDLYKNGVLIETPKYITETVATEQNTPIVYSGERLYPSQYARRNYFGRIDGLSPDEYYISDADNPYGRGKYIVKYSSRYNTNTNYSPHYVFNRPITDTVNSYDATWASNQYSSGNYVGTNSLGGKKGDWITIQMPSKIILTRYIFVSIQYQNGIYRCRLPHKYTIYGCNDGDEKWEAIIHDSLATDGSSFTHTYVNSNDSYMKVITDSERLTGEKEFNTFALLVEKVGNWNSSHNSLLAMAEFELYGKEKISTNFIYENITNTLDFTQESIYPPSDLNTSALSTGTTLTNNRYGNGLYVITRGSGNADLMGGSTQSPHLIFNDTASPTWKFHSASVYNDTSTDSRIRTYNGSTADSDPTGTGYNGTWIKLQMPVKIRLSKIKLVQRLDTSSSYPAWNKRMPRKFKIFGSNDNITWTPLFQYENYDNLLPLDITYKLDLDIPNANYESSYILIIVNAIGLQDGTLNFKQIELYGKERIARASVSNIQTPIYKNVIAYPQSNSTSNAMINNNTLVAEWNDNNYYFRSKASEIHSASYPLYHLFDNINNTQTNNFHSPSRYNTGAPYAYNNTTTLGGTKGVYIMIDIGRGIYPSYIGIMPRSNVDWTSLNFTTGAPGIFKLFASNDDSCYYDSNHSSWTEIFHQSTNIGSSAYANSTYTYFNIDHTITRYRYYALVTTHLTGSYGYLMMTDLRIFGTENLNNDYKYMALTYYEPGEFANNVDFDYPVLTADATNLIAWYKFDKNYLDSVGSNHLTSVGTDTPLFQDNSLLLSGTPKNEKLQMPNFDFRNTDLTVSFRFKPITFVNSEQLIHFNNTSSVYNRLQFYTRDNGTKFQVIYQGNGGTDLNADDGSGVPLTLNEWHSIIFVITNGLQSLYVNNVLKGTTNGTHITHTYNNNSIGYNNPDCKCLIEDFRIYDKALSSTEITELYEPYRQSQGQSQYKVTFPEETECDVLVVGGGGAGGVNNGGGGGGGGVLYATNLTLNGEYILKIGNGGNVAATNTQSLLSENGYNTLFGKSGDFLEVFGGGRGANANGATVTPNKNGADGGSGGGGSNNDGTGGSSIQPNYSTLITSVNSSYYGGTGGTSVNDTNGGGGGAGGVTPNIKNGADGIQINITGNNYYWGGGGGGADWNTLGGSGGKGGGGGAGGTSGNGGSGGTGGISVGSDGTGSGGANAQTGVGGDGGPGTGGGGGANAAFNGSVASGNGGSGIVIIRYKTIYNTSSYNLSQWTYNSDDSVYHMGKVGIGTANPSTELDVMGDVTGNTKNFKIIHPLNDKKWLLHGTIEAPRYENIYRGKKTIKNGKCSISIDRDCNESGGMTQGTFIALNKNYQLYLQNNNTYDKVLGNIGTDGIIRIRCENTTDEIEIDWMVIGERKDSNVINEPITNASGSLICEHYMYGYNENNVDM